MRLEKIKLAGFKSFVDPTTVYFPSNLVCVVGPNGCGKSNIIDAVRWVMGESSAKNLRGESMTDVIFNGSSSRKPIGQASIELIFDNADGRAGGEYAQYAEISVRRVVTRDATSTYFLNGTKCRRRDITDLFAGTGLGPRSYAIIEQGMISRLIESKPEELRVFLEQAAGISKYKDRRRETATRMRHTRENLERLTDVRDEVAKQLAHLKRQAETAERYQALKLEERQVELELMSLRWRGLNDQAEEQQRLIAERNNRVEEVIASQRRVEAEIEAQREAHGEVTDQLNQVQSQFYQIGGEITRLEQAVAHIKERKQQLMNDIADASRQSSELLQHQQQDIDKCETLEADLASDEPELAVLTEQENRIAEQLSAVEHALHTWQSHWDDFNQQMAMPSEQAQVERTKINHLEEHAEQLKARIMKAAEELERVNDTQLVLEIEGLGEQAQHWQANYERELALVTEVKADIQDMREQSRQETQVLDQEKAKLQQALGTKASLEALQQAALSQGDNAIQAWLTAHQLQDRQRLAQVIEVDAGWDKAVEMVLGDYLEAIGCEGLLQYQQALQALDQGSIILWDQHSHSECLSRQDAPKLWDKIRCPWDLSALLQGVLIADSLDHAVALQAHLKAGESVVTSEGIWLSPTWIRVVKSEDENSGVIARAQALRNVTAELDGLETHVAILTEQQADRDDVLQDKELERDDHQALANQAQKNLSEYQTKLSAKETRLEHLHQRHAELQIEKAQLDVQAAEENEQILSARQVLHEALESMEVLSERRDELVAERDQCRQNVADFRAQAKRCRDERQEIALRVGSMKAQQQSTQDNLTRLQAQILSVTERQETLTEQLEETAEPLLALSEDLEVYLEQKLTIEVALSDARAVVDQVDQQIRKLERERTEGEQQAVEFRAKLDEARLAYEGIMVRRQTVQEALGDAFAEVEGVLAGLDVDAQEPSWKRRLDELRRDIQRLGNINLAAIDEYAEQSERQRYLDEQYEDLTESLTLLENAIQKIDRETRALFKETFEAVDAKLRMKFPKLFGGGSAYLELTGNDLLDTGVTIMARPPGKRNSTIHLLSGGEKALTAIALVFSIFELNPAPFCMLDEVDAPLDEANVGRYSQLVKEMSAQVQFIFITHNKVTMEIANQLSGVTMHEPGVSRIVSVDVDEAVEMAAS